ncbi:MAG: DUF6588 family protein [Elusimicrobiota bacterium]
MKKLGIAGLVTILMFLPVLVNADWVTDAQNKAESELEPVVGDIGAGLSGGVIRSAAFLKFPGLDAGLNITGAKVSDDNSLISEGTIPVPLGSVKIALPKGIAVFIRGLNYGVGDSDSKLNMLGFGGKYTVVEEKTVPFIPEISGVVAYNMLNVSTTDMDIGINTITIGCAVSKKLPLISPYLGLSYNISSGSFESSAMTVKPSKNSFRAEAGVDFRPFPFFYVGGGISNLGWNIGLGLRFQVPV